ncbi:SH3 domain-containing protein [Helicobacter sp.]|uniref:SH3 domain-containing protein n=1 Tax=Helicobacter sp. TaxID=218 RepID=UPI0025BEF87F|nr:SH3 domain-containing protein [Helicobacter sp.]MCI5969511.1 SH3 domain-containing protein [Helicobacter sp.]MDY2584779.1 SH3 domain-containing protein [Helicobacter sp.]
MRIAFALLCAFWVFGIYGVVFAEEARILEVFRVAESRLSALGNVEAPLLVDSINDEAQNTDFKKNAIDAQTPLPDAAIEDAQGNMESKNPSSEFEQDTRIKDLFKAASNNSLVKNVYLEARTPLVDILYVNQVIALEFKMLIFTQYSAINTEFIFEDFALKDSVEVLNPRQPWVLNVEDSSLKNTFYLKIKQSQFAIPSLKVDVHTSDGLVSESLVGSNGRAIKLERKGAYSQVLAQDLQILDTKITSYDLTQNLAVFQLQSTMGNLFDFHLDSYKQQGIESKSGDDRQAVAFYYVIVPKTLDVISFDYFNTQNAKYQTLKVPNIAIEDRVSTQSDIRPKNNYQFFQISLMVFFALLFFGLYVYKRKVIFVVFAVFALGLLLYFLTLKSTVTLKPNVVLRIQPTFNSTIVLTTQNAIKAEILGERNHYYKVLLEDERIGWVRKDDVQD